MAKYPGVIPTLDEIFKAIDFTDWTNASKWNNLRAELRAALVELGTLPKGSYADVKTRLNAMGVADKISEGDSSVEVIDTDGDGHVEVKTENVLCGKFHNDGILDLPKQSAISVYRLAAWNIPHGSYTQIPFDTEPYDIQNEAGANGRFTAKKAGKYHVTLLITTEDADKHQLRANIKLNGASKAEFIENTQHTYVLHAALVSKTLSLAANDYVDGYTFQYNYTNAGAVVAKVGGTYFFMTVEKVG